MNYTEIYSLIGAGAYLFTGALTVAVDAYVEYRQKIITQYDEYNRHLALQITLLWPFAWLWMTIDKSPKVLFWVFNRIGGNPFLNIKQSVSARRRQKGTASLYDQDASLPEFTD